MADEQARSPEGDVLDPKKQPLDELLTWVAEDCGNDAAEAEIRARLEAAARERERLRRLVRDLATVEHTAHDPTTLDAFAALQERAQRLLTLKAE